MTQGEQGREERLSLVVVRYDASENNRIRRSHRCKMERGISACCDNVAITVHTDIFHKLAETR